MTKKKAPREMMTPEEIADLLVDVLVDAGFVDAKNVDAAIKVLAEEIEVRKAFGDM